MKKAKPIDPNSEQYLSESNFFERVAEALLTMRTSEGANQPDILLFLQHSKWDHFAFTEICGIKIIKAPFQVDAILPGTQQRAKAYCPIIPLWNQELEQVEIDSRTMKFQKAFIEAS